MRCGIPFSLSDDDDDAHTFIDHEIYLMIIETSMCWNDKVSLSTFVLAVAGIVIGYINDLHDVRWSVFYLVVASMQLLEFFVWRHLNDVVLNRWLSMLGLLILFMQPLSAGLLIRERSYIVHAAFYVCCILWILAYLSSSWPIKWSTTVAPNGHLSWNWLRLDIWLAISWTAIVLTAIFLSDIPRRNKVLVAMFVLCTIAISYRYGKKEARTWGSVYCSFINMMFVIIIGKAMWTQYSCALPARL